MTYSVSPEFIPENEIYSEDLTGRNHFQHQRTEEDEQFGVWLAEQEGKDDALPELPTTVEIRHSIFGFSLRNHKQ